MWLALAIVGDLLRVRYSLGAFSFAPAVALLSGTWLGWRRAALVQTVAAATLISAGAVFAGLNNPGDWGFRVGLIASAALAGVISTPDGNGAHPVRAIRLAVFGAAGLTAAVARIIVPRQSSGAFFAATLVLATVITVYYSYRMVPEPGRVVGYAFCLLPYYTAGMAWNAMMARWLPAQAVLAGVPDRWDELVFHGYLAHLPNELIAIVVISVLVCALDRRGAADGPMVIGAPR